MAEGVEHDAGGGAALRGDTKEALLQIQEQFRAVLQPLRPGVALPFEPGSMCTIVHIGQKKRERA